MEVKKQVRYAELDALRGIAALLVVFFHFTMGRPEYNHMFKVGTTGVDLFFIISGFVIFMSISNISHARDFVINRISRLYPTYWASIAFTFLLISAYAIFKGNFHPLDALIKFLGNLTMFQFYLGIPDLDGPYWTMIIEMIFYISILVLFCTDLLKYINAIGIIVCAITVLAANFYFEQILVSRILKWIPLLQFLPLFFAGTVFYRIYSDRKNLISNYLIIVFCFLCQLALFPYAGRSNRFITIYEYNLMLTIYFMLFVLFVNFRLRFIVNDITLFFGKISFALYLIHQYISQSVIIPLFYGRLGLNFWITVIFINLPVLIVIAALITYKIEIPYSKRMKESLRRKFN